MYKETTYPGLYMAEDSDTRTIVPALCAQGYYVIMLRGRTSENETFLGRRYYDYSDAAVAETRVITGCIDDICAELLRPRDHYSKVILAKQIRRILDYITRFHERQFITRDLIVERIVARYDKLLERYIETGRLRANGLPTNKYCADRLFLSEACFCDVLMHKTGCTHDCYFQAKRIEIAKRRLTGSDISLSQLVADLGFPSVRYFCYLFKKLTGCTPGNYRLFN